MSHQMQYWWHVCKYHLVDRRHHKRRHHVVGHNAPLLQRRARTPAQFDDELEGRARHLRGRLVSAAVRWGCYLASRQRDRRLDKREGREHLEPTRCHSGWVQ